MIEGVKSTADVVLESLRRDILTGHLAGGSKLKQNDIAAAFNVSASPVREALQRLVASGLAISSPNRGVSVAPMTERDFIDIAELRLMLEPRAIRLSAPRLTDEDLHTAESLLNRAAQSSSAVVRAELHWQFHLTLYSRADRPRLLAQIEALYISLARYICPVWDRIGLSPNWVETHTDILNAVRDKQFALAEALTKDQLNGGLERWQEQAALVRKESTR